MTESPAITASRIETAPVVVPRRNRRRWWIVSVLLLIVAGGVGFGVYSYFHEEQSQVYLVAWQAMVDDQTGEILKKVFTPIEGQDLPPADLRVRGHSTRSRSSKSGTDPQEFRGKADKLRLVLRRRIDTNQPIHLSRKLNFECLTNPTAPVETWEDRFSALYRWLNTRLGMQERRGLFVAGGIGGNQFGDQESEATWKGKTFAASGYYSARWGFGTGVKVHVYGGRVLANTEDSTDGRSTLNTATIPFGWQETLEDGDVVLMLNRFPGTPQTPVLVTVCERSDVDGMASYQAIGPDLNRPREWISHGRSSITNSARKAYEFTRQASTKFPPLRSHLTKRLEDSTQISLLLLTIPSRYPSTFWTPDGSPMRVHSRVRELIQATHENSRELPIAVLYVSPGSAESPIHEQVAPRDLRVLRSRNLNGVISLWRPESRRDGSQIDASQRSQFFIIPCRLLPNKNKAVIDFAVGEGEFRRLGQTVSKGALTVDGRTISVETTEVPSRTAPYVWVNARGSLSPNEELSLVLVMKDGRRLLGTFPHTILPIRNDGTVLQRDYLNFFVGCQKAEIDHIEVRVRPTRSYQFTDFVTEPKILQDAYPIDNLWN